MLAHLDLLDHQQAIGAALRRQLVVSSALLGATAMIVSGDSDLLRLADQIPVYTPTAFLALPNLRRPTSDRSTVWRQR